MDRNVVITGASRGLGLALTRRFLEAGDTVWGVSRTRRGWAGTRALANSSRLSLACVDVTCEKKTAAYIRKTVAKAGTIDILINNAGYGGTLAKVEDMSIREIEKHWRLNLLSAFLVTKYALPQLRKQGQGCIVNIASMAAQRAVPGLFGYSAAKFAMRALSQCTAKEYAEANIKCWTACPGGMNTEMRASLFGKDDAARQQSADFVAGIIFDGIEGKIQVESGGEIVIRHGQISAIHPAPPA